MTLHISQIKTTSYPISGMTVNERSHFDIGYEIGAALAKAKRFLDEPGALHDALNEAGSTHLSDEYPNSEYAWAFNLGMSEGWSDHTEAL